MTRAFGHVPVDVLQGIFYHSVQISRRDAWNEESLFTSWKAPMSVPLYLSQVCWLWREVAMICPSLWTDITVIVDGTSNREKDQRLIEAFDTLVRRSRTLPLTLSVTCDTYGLSEGELDTAAYVLRRLLHEQHRWKGADFIFIERDPTRLPPFHLVHVPLLETLTLCWRKADRHMLKQVHVGISCSPNLGTLHIKGIPRIETRELSGLIDLSLRGLAFDISPRVLLDMLRSMPNLESLEARFLKGELDESNDRQPYLTLDKLRTLLVDDTEASAYTVSKLILPALKCLICRPYPYNSFGRLLLMLNHSKPPLEHLEVSDYDFTDGRLDDLLRLFPELKSLYMVRFGITCSFFDKLSATYVDDIFMDEIQEQFVLCPKLTTLHFKDLRWIMGVDYCLTSISHMVTKRCALLGLAGTLKCQSKEANADGYCEISQFNLPPADGYWPQIYDPIAEAGRMEIGFEPVDS